MTTPSTVPPQSEIDFSDATINHDPYPHLRQVGRLARAVWNPPSQSWFINSFDDVKSVFMNYTDFAQDSVMFESLFGGPTMAGVDNPRHDELRSVLGPHMSRRALANCAGLSRELADDHFGPVVERLRSGEHVDVAPIFRDIPTYFVARLLGVPKEDCRLFIEWADRMNGVFELKTAPGVDDAELRRQDAARATEELREYSAKALAERERTGDASDFLGILATTKVDLTENEKHSYITALIFGAQDTTATFGKNTAVAFAQHPDQRRAIQQDRTLLRQALDEVIRWQPPVFAEMRVVRHAGVEFGGVPLEEGDYVSLVIGAAHRDTSRWEDPDTFDIFRPAKGNLGFGFAVHSCLGVNLARLEVETIFNKLLDEVPDYQLALSDDELDYGTYFSVRGPSVVPLSL
ncbi:cytochrome P450 [Mycobacterium sp. CBMA293]|uniref:cytochrome P450 n=1 Tax=unclassified Mycolicibacterium TaxID=2636767 RepID=UPI0012DD17A5|nr:MULTISPECIES: cytochrome P450 [unclassified Mycolicibacterium]MUL49877.1 cytochrome P450 [Mycolicibacterium sp. CBMA 360]MUL62696.1 cytochrome P450 [Mycolicibacterium sp. CBMA 335]MUL70756.1 cytochrome P450 [Mycolicibacterium sp. CBMA 311]MUL97220.1 cytochrome P450 [Mycolicibacterium sp. CBMA 230]MUM07969.1 hypothetical protein [Mycolicibacterium sp. CBMA 213]